MLLLSCPYCGPRAQIEFSCGGESHIARPAVCVDDARWADYLFTRSNSEGTTLERWVHGAGCQQWFNVARHTRTHAILAVYRMGEQPPVLTP
jgi:sarcosine oxidase subunit delta